jgi:hypothetical protein
MATSTPNLFGPSGSKGASQAENTIANDQTSFMQTLQKDFGTTFANQQNVLNALNQSLSKTLAGGPSQYGFSAPENAALNTRATTLAMQTYRNSLQATRAAQAAAGGGGATLPTGAAAGPEAQLAQATGENLSNNLLGIQEKGYEVGRQNYGQAVSGLTNVAQLENPQSYANPANTASQNAFGMANTIQQQNQAANPWPQIGGLAGSLAGTALNMVAPGAGTALSSLSSGLTRTMGTQAAQLPSQYQPQTQSDTTDWGGLMQGSNTNLMSGLDTSGL